MHMRDHLAIHAWMRFESLATPVGYKTLIPFSISKAAAFPAASQA